MKLLNIIGFDSNGPFIVGNEYESDFKPMEMILNRPIPPVKPI